MTQLSVRCPARYRFGGQQGNKRANLEDSGKIHLGKGATGLGRKDASWFLLCLVHPGKHQGV